MQRLRSQFEYDRDSHSPSAERTAINRFELRCGMCGATVFIDEALKDQLQRAFDRGLKENPVLCEECELDFDDAEASE